VTHGSGLTAHGSRLITPRIRDLPPSPTIAVAKEAERLRGEGVDVVDFGPGEPDFDTPEHVREAAVRALREGLTHYAPSRGFPQLRQAIAVKLERENRLRYNPDTEIVVTPGAKQAILEAVFVAAGEGDEAIVFDPGWGSYAAIVRLAGAQPVHVQARPDFTIDAARLQAAVTARTRAVVVGSPGNPTGHVLEQQEWVALAHVCRENDLLLISDEIYERITYDGVRGVSPATLPGMWERTVTVNGLSKAYAMTGWRLGYAAAPAPILSQMLKVHEHSVTTATSFAQMGAIAALEGSQDPIRAMVAEFRTRREIICSGLNAVPGVICPVPDGAFYVFPEISGTGHSGTELARLLLDHGVAVTPGIGFGEEWDTHVRLSYATSEERIRTGLTRIREAVEK
jgi:aspartate aminotransferase